MSNQNIADVYVEPQSALGYQGGALNNSYDYNLSVSNGGEIYSINGVSITPATSVSLQYTPGTGYQVNGSSTVISSINRALPEDFEVGVINSNTGATTLTVQSVGVSSTAEIDFVAGAPVKVAHFSPSASTLNLGQTEMVTFQIQDVNGNPVPNTAVEIEDDQSPYDPFWVTGVNGVALQENFETSNNTSVVQPTPIPLGQLTTVAPNLNYSVAMPGVVYWNYSNPNTFDVFSNASGDVTLTLQAGQTIYPNLTTSTVSNAVYSAVYTAQMPSGYTSWTGGEPAIGFYTNTNSTGSSVPLYIATTNVSGGTISSLDNTATVTALNPNGTLQGEINW